ncbi:hypothetical protein HAX54_029387 [Datura stramonium]|uniref:Uncharacterized protein n=1 Tax=Datura stramonium TaxID=4076 RepID=A0ABS8V813_DATST|nr:hypothetical protein [Datura stramonium]
MLRMVVPAKRFGWEGKEKAWVVRREPCSLARSRPSDICDIQLMLPGYRTEKRSTENTRQEVTVVASASVYSMYNKCIPSVSLTFPKNFFVLIPLAVFSVSRNMGGCLCYE